jgi:hypothetical protein
MVKVSSKSKSKRKRNLHKYTTEHLKYTNNNYRDVLEYTSKEECDKFGTHVNNLIRNNKIITNKKFSNTNPKRKFDEKRFDHMEYHAGDIADYYKYGFYNSMLNNVSISPKSFSQQLNHVDYEKQQLYYAKFFNKLNSSTTLQTFHYMYNKFKKGIFVSIKNNKLEVFLPFSKAHYTNNWYKNLYINNFDKRMLDKMWELEKKLKTQNRNHSISPQTLQEFLILERKTTYNFMSFLKANRQKINSYDLYPNRRRWYANNCLFRGEYWEGEKLINLYKHFFMSLLDARKVPDCEFFVNPRDFPIMKRDLTEPYNHLHNSTTKTDPEFTANINTNYTPILSYSSRYDHADIPIPTPDDWLTTSQKMFATECTDRYHLSKLQNLVKKWEDKKSLVTFRGKVTGCGITPETNIRLRATQLSDQYPDLIDVKITNWNARIKKYQNIPIATRTGGPSIINAKKLQNDLHLKSNLKDYFQTVEERSGFKYILNLDGHTSAHRLGFEFSLGSVVITHESPDYLWFKPWMVALNKSKSNVSSACHIEVKQDLSDLPEMVRWCQAHDTECKKIAENGYKFYQKVLEKPDFMYDYMVSILSRISNSRVPFSLESKEMQPKSLAIIVSYRDDPTHMRKHHLELFTNYMRTVLPKTNPKLHFKIYIVEQLGNDTFNIGKTKNIGFSEAMRDHAWNYCIFTDIDILPDTDLLSYYINPEDDVKNTIMCLGSRGTVYDRFDFEEMSYVDSSPFNQLKPEQLASKLLISYNKPFMGSVLGMTPDTFRTINGYPNNFWGWGGEDDELLLRCGYTNTKCVLPKKGRVIDLEGMETGDIKSRNKDKAKEMSKIEKLSMSSSTWKTNGINNIEYQIKSREELPSSNVVHLKADVMFDKKETVVPQLSVQGYKKTQQYLAKMFRRTKVTQKHQSKRLSKQGSIKSTKSKKLRVGIPDYRTRFRNQFDSVYSNFRSKST